MTHFKTDVGRCFISKESHVHFLVARKAHFVEICVVPLLSKSRSEGGSAGKKQKWYSLC